MLVSKTSIQNFLPQQPPILLVDELIDYSSTNFRITPETIFTNDDQFQPSGLLENMAQSAMLSGSFGLLNNGGSPAEGYLVSVNNLRIFKLPVVGDNLLTRIENVHQILNIVSVTTNVFVNEELFASAELKLLINPQ